ncbi:hypothetical protein HY36_16775 [Hyphomonas atlantica]|uniref:Uncharacterized protein n=1 Tax=Hyphomonas atlantica TaxID=1280948 RepID=A0A059E0I1_9PROT|nr:hypothetical protein HY36_16775 [Hyphomonas atlantica]
MAKYEHDRSIHLFKKKKNDNGWMWAVGIVVFLIILAAA